DVSPSGLPALSQCKQIVIPLAVSVGPQVLSILTIDDRNVGSPAVHLGVKRIRAAVDRIDDLLPGPFPSDPPSMKWSDLKYVFWHQGGPICRGRGTSLRRLSRSCGKSTAACVSRLQTTRTGGLRADIIRVAGYATPTGSAGHAGVTASSQLTFHLDHSMQVGHFTL